MRVKYPNPRVTHTAGDRNGGFLRRVADEEEPQMGLIIVVETVAPGTQDGSWGHLGQGGALESFTV